MNHGYHEKQSGFSNSHGLAGWFFFSVAVPVALYAFGFVPGATAGAPAASQNQGPGTSPLFKAMAGKHISSAGAEVGSIYSHRLVEGAIPPVTMASTRSSFLASWDSISGAAGYRLDVSISSSFSSYVSGYQDLDVGSATNRIVSGLRPGTIYHYRVRAYNSLGASSGSIVKTATTAATTSGLVINPAFDSSILNDPNAAAIQSMINQTIAIYQALFNDPVTIQIRFRYATTSPDGTPLPAGRISQSDFVIYTRSWSTFINALRADATTSNDNLANASLPGSALSANIVMSSANGRAVSYSLNTPPAMFADGTVGNGGPYDGIVTLNSSNPFQFSRPTSAGNFDAQRSTEHEIDEVMGLGSHLDLDPPGTDLRPQDVFSWSSPGVRNLTSSGARYFSIDSGSTNIVNFNQDPHGDFGDWLSPACPQTYPYVQNAFGCTGQSSDVASTSPEGINLDVIGYDLIGHPAFFSGETALGGGWYYLQFPNSTPFGYYTYLTDPHFIYHLDLGFEYLIDANNANRGIYFYDFASSSFLYTSPSTFPYLYDFSLNAWLYYLPDASNPGRYSHNPRWFYNFATSQWITL
jgi:Fibronectin type III domain